MMKPIDFLKAVAAVLPGRPSASRTAAMAQFAVKVDGEFRNAGLNHSMADLVARRVGDNFPTWAELAEAIRDALPAASTSREPSSRAGDEEGRIAGHWENYALRRLREGGDRAHLLSLVKRYAPPGHLREIMERAFQPELAEQDARDAEVRRDKVAVAQRFAERAVRNVTTLPVAPRGPTVTTRPVIDHEPIKRDGHLAGEALEAQRAAAGIITRRAAE